MKTYLVDVPVRVNIWIRFDCLKKQFDVLKIARPSVIFVQSDGGRNESEWNEIFKGRELYDKNIDWDCRVYKLYENVNNGMYEMAKKTYGLIWSKVDRCIMLEDDIIPSVSFFQYCAELLEKYKEDQRIECICGMNHLGVYKDVNSDYFFSRQGSIWGYATWKRVFEGRSSLDYVKDEYVKKILKQRTRHNKIAWKRIMGYLEHETYEGHVPGNEFWYEFDMYSQNRLQIIPKYNMISNIGCNEKATNSAELRRIPHGLRKVFNMVIYDINFPIKHPQYVMPDIEYEKERNKIMAYNTPCLLLMRRLEKFILEFRYGNKKHVLKHYIGKVIKRK